ncbi:MAG: hypothetical protein M0P71_12000 [Melioribacteraceae bacterium]|jgi:hypothetical protein|nr:hypothetical protein [Melioribacteraceae bacterium]
MDNFTILSVIKDYATTQGWHFLSGNNFNQNYEASQNTYNPGDLVLTADFDAIPIFGEGNSISEIRYTGIIALGRKVEDDDLTRSNLDETFWQKYELRLEALMTLLSTAIISIGCENNMTVQDVRFRMELNKFDTNIDFVVTPVTFLQ